VGHTLLPVLVVPESDVAEEVFARDVWGGDIYGTDLHAAALSPCQWLIPSRRNSPTSHALPTPSSARIRLTDQPCYTWRTRRYDARSANPTVQAASPAAPAICWFAPAPTCTSLLLGRRALGPPHPVAVQQPPHRSPAPSLARRPPPTAATHARPRDPPDTRGRPRTQARPPAPRPTPQRRGVAAEPAALAAAAAAPRTRRAPTRSAAELCPAPPPAGARSSRRRTGPAGKCGGQRTPAAWRVAQAGA
jgi:hypothetical protein